MLIQDPNMTKTNAINHPVVEEAYIRRNNKKRDLVLKSDCSRKDARNFAPTYMQLLSDLEDITQKARETDSDIAHVEIKLN